MLPRPGSTTAMLRGHRRAASMKYSCKALALISPLRTFRQHQLLDARRRVQVLRIDFVRLQCYAKAFFQEQYELQRGNRVENPPRDQRGIVGKLIRVLAGQEFVEDELLYRLLDVIRHFGSSLFGWVFGRKQQ